MSDLLSQCEIGRMKIRMELSQSASGGGGSGLDQQSNTPIKKEKQALVT